MAQHCSDGNVRRHRSRARRVDALEGDAEVEGEIGLEVVVGLVAAGGRNGRVRQRYELVRHGSVRTDTDSLCQQFPSG